MRLKYVAREFDERLGAEITTLERLSVSQYRGVIPSSENSARVQEPSSYEKYKVVQPGDLVLNRFNAYKGALGISSYNGVVSPDYMTVKLDTSRVDIRYIEYFLKSVETSAAIKMSMSGMGSSDPDSSAFSRLDKDDLFNLLLPITDLETQRRIADYLDKEISEMDALIVEFSRLAENLRLRRATKIKALTESAQSDLVAIGVISEVKLGKMLTTTPSSEDGEVKPYLRAAHIQPAGRLDLTVEEKKMWFSSSEMESLSLKKDDILLVEGGAGFGRSVILTSDLQGTGFQNSINRVRVNVNLAHPKFVFYMLQSAKDEGLIDMICDTATIPHFTSEKVSRFKIPLPTLEKQREIADELDREFARMDALIEESTRLIENLKARKTALMTEVVTGRKEV